MKRWAAALAISLAMHSMLLLLPGASLKTAEPPGAFRVALRPGPIKGGEPSGQKPAGEEKSGGASSRSVQVEESAKKTSPPAPEAKPSPKAAKEPAKKSHPQKPRPQVRPVQRAEVPEPSEGPVGQGAALGERSAAPKGGEGRAAAKPSNGEPVDVNTLRILSRTPPEYPLFSRRRREEGEVRILLTVRSGQVTDARITTGSGFPRLDEAALKAVRLWKFDYPGEVRARAGIVFRLK